MTPARRAGSSAARRAVRRPASEDYLTPPEVAELLRTTPGVLKKWRYLGTGPAYVKPGRVLYPRTDLDAWIESTRTA